MFSPLRNRFGIPGVISVIALVFALAGGAYAADSGDGATASAKKKNRKGKQGGLNAKQKRQVRNISANIAKRFQGTGPIGPQGFPGLPGAPGEDGDDGDDGSDGQNGENGEDGSDGASVTSTEFEGEEGPCEDGGSKFVSASGTTYACNGGGGTTTPSLPATLPSESTLTGGWTLGYVTSAMLPPSSLTGVYVPISFPVPLPAVLDEDHVHFIEPGGDEVVINGVGARELVGPTADCSGDAGQPTAAAGHLCVYAGSLTDGTSSGSNLIGTLTQDGVPGPAGPPFFGGGVGGSKAGAVMSFPSFPGFLQSGSSGWGAWAVTAAAG